jgi:NADPH-dependent curcumin reductase CurA
MEGIVVFDYAARYGEAVAEMSKWMAEGKFHTREDIVKGIETFPDTLMMLFDGKNFGKLILQVADE